MREKIMDQFIKDAAAAYAAKDFEEANRLAFVVLGIYNGAGIGALWDLYGVCVKGKVNE